MKKKEIHTMAEFGLLDNLVASARKRIPGFADSVKAATKKSMNFFKGKFTKGVNGKMINNAPMKNKHGVVLKNQTMIGQLLGKRRR